MMKKLQKTLLSAAVLVALAACGGRENLVPQVTAQMDLANTKVGLPSSFTVTVSDGNSDLISLLSMKEKGAAVTASGTTYTLSTGVLQLVSTSQKDSVTAFKFAYIPTSSAATSVQLSFTDGEATSSMNLQLAGAANDPLFSQQWHLQNTGQKAYALNADYKQFLINMYVNMGMSVEQATQVIGAYWARQEAKLVKGEDMNVMPAYAKGVTGQGTVAVVVDSGLEIAHEDLQANVLPNRSLNFVAGVVNPMDPTNPSAMGDHGTSVAGLIAAVGWNGKGGHGVAPDAKLIGMNYLEEQSDLAFMISHGIPGSGISESEPVAVFNRSYGITYPTALSYNEFEDVVQMQTTFLRDGKGAVNTKSSGNSFVDGGTDLENDLCKANGANSLKLTCYNANMENSQSSPYYFSIGAVNSDGKHTSYSNAGANLTAVAPSGEYGDDAPAMVTTDQSTCLRGYSSFGFADLYDNFFGTGYFAAAYPFNNPGHEDNLSCNYTSSFNGTSSAAPNAAGVVALILSANPNLTYRDVRHIIASTSTKVDANNAPVVLNVGGGTFVAHQGWVKNKAGFEFNNLYGFGRVNAGKAVEMAKNYTAKLGAEKTSPWVGIGVYAAKPTALSTDVPDNSAAGAAFDLVVTDDMVLEGAQFQFQIANAAMTLDNFGGVGTTAGTDLAIEVTSPSGTRSVLLSSKQALVVPAAGADFFDGYILKDSVMLSNAFYGESAKGTWKIKVLDVNGSDIEATGGLLKVSGYKNNSRPSVVEGVAIRVYGH